MLNYYDHFEPPLHNPEQYAQSLENLRAIANVSQERIEIIRNCGSLALFIGDVADDITQVVFSQGHIVNSATTEPIPSFVDAGARDLTLYTSFIMPNGQPLEVGVGNAGVITDVFNYDTAFARAYVANSVHIGAGRIPHFASEHNFTHWSKEESDGFSQPVYPFQPGFQTPEHIRQHARTLCSVVRLIVERQPDSI